MRRFNEGTVWRRARLAAALLALVLVILALGVTYPWFTRDAYSGTTVNISQGHQYDPALLKQGLAVTITEMPPSGEHDFDLEQSIVDRMLEPETEKTNRDAAKMELQIMIDLFPTRKTYFARPDARMNMMIGIGICQNPFIGVDGFRRFQCSYKWLEILEVEGDRCPTFADEIASILTQRERSSATDDPRDAFLHRVQHVCSKR